MRLGVYELEAELGHGASGTVYRARSPDGRSVAVKALHAAGADALARFERERKVLAELGHAAGFVELLDAAAGPRGPFLVLELVPGGTLRDRLARGPLAIEDAIALGRTLAAALGKAHARGVVHRDLKPENVLFTERGATARDWGEPLVADLGLAKHFGAATGASLSRTGELRGTVAYMAPEQLADAKHVGPASDVFALGAILYECLAGEPPFRGDTVLEVIQNVAQGRFAPLARRRGGVPAWLASVIERSLSAEPTDRPGDGVAFARALTAAPRSRRPLAAAGLLSVAALVGGGAVLLLERTAPSSTPPPRPAAPPPPPPRPSGVGPVATASASVERPPLRAELAALYPGSRTLELGWALGSTERKLGDQVWGIDVSLDERFVLAGDVSGFVRLFDLTDGREIWWAKVGDAVNAVALDLPRGRALAGCRTGEVLVLAATTGDVQRQLTRHSKHARAIATSPDGALALSGGGDGVARLHDLATGRALRAFSHGKDVSAVAFSPDGRSVLTGSFDGKVRIFDVEGDAPPRTFEAGQIVFAAAFSPDGRTFATSDESRVALWDRETGATRVEASTSKWGFGLAFTPDGQRIVTACSDGAVQVRDAQSLALVREDHHHAMQASSVRCRGSLLVSGSWDGTVRVVDLATGREVRPLAGHAGAVNALAFSSGGRVLVSAGFDRRLHSWELASGRSRATDPTPHTLRVVAASRDSKRLAFGGDSASFGVIEGVPEVALRPGASGAIVGLGFGASGRLVGASANGLLWWGDDPADPERRIEVGDQLVALDVDAEGDRALVGGKSGVHLYDLEAKTSRVDMTGAGVLSVALARDARTGFAVAWNGGLAKLDLTTRESVEIGRGAPPVSSIALSPDGRRLACVTGDYALEIRDSEDGRVLDRIVFGAGDRPRAVAFDQQGKLAVGTARGMVLVYEPK